jgi:SSS family transporter
MPWWAISLSIVATETSTLTFLGAPAIAFTGDLTFLQLAIGYLVGKILVSLILIPGYFRGEIQTAYELLQIRFGLRVRNLSALIFQVTRTLADGVRLYATALVLSVVTELADTTTVVIIGLITVIYTFYGGMTAVVWNDAIQLVIYVGGALLAFFLILERIPGGWLEAVALAEPDQKLQVLNFSWDFAEPYTFFAGIVGGAFLTFATHGTDQMMVQRYLACGSRRKSQLALIASGAIVIAQFLLFLVIGVLLYAFYHHFPLDRDVEQINRILPIFIVEEMPPGVSGLIIAAIFAAAMSTLSSSLNSLSSSSVNDFYRALFVRDGSESHYLKASRIFTLAWGAVLIAVSLLARSWGEVLQAGLTIASLTIGSLLGVFLLGTLTTRVGEGASLLGMLASLVVMAGIGLTSDLAWTWYVLVGTAVTVVVGLLVSFFSPEEQPKHKR